jgi:hypothetical protein
MPKNVRRFVWLWLGAWVVFVPALFDIPVPPATMPDGTVFQPPEAAVIGVFIVSAVLVLALFLPFLWLAVWRRKNWARWILFLLYLISLPLTFVGPYPYLFRIPLVGALASASILIEALAFVFIFTGDAQPWYRT